MDPHHPDSIMNEGNSPPRLKRKCTTSPSGLRGLGTVSDEESLDVIDDFGWDPPAQDLGGGEPSGLTAWWGSEASRKAISNAAQARSSPPPRTFIDPSQPYKPTCFFFNGAIEKLNAISRIIGAVTDPPRLRPARIEGYILTFWGDLLPGQEGNAVHGSAIWVDTLADAATLGLEDPQRDKTADCTILFVDGKDPKVAEGKTYIYARDANALLERAINLGTVDQVL
ncbi:hypothetical protein MMC20_004489 [Loxospora ochrophaea]|nr:hypothetical protein [Loxospora ochrophaea]